MRKYHLLKKVINYENIDLPLRTLKTKVPYRLGRAKILGYKNTPEYVSYISSTSKGGISARPTKKGRKPMNQCRKYSRDISHKNIIINKIKKNRKNLILVGAYCIKKDKKRVYYEVLFKDKNYLLNNLNL